MKSFKSWSIHLILAVATLVMAGPVAAEICLSRDSISLDRDPFTPAPSSERIDFEMPRTGTLEVITTIASNSVPKQGTQNFLKIIEVNGTSVYVIDMAEFVGVVNSGPLSIPAGANVSIEYDIRTTTGAAVFDMAIDVAEGCSSVRPFVVDEFSDAAGGGLGWAPGSNWEGNLSYVSENAIKPLGLQHVRSDGIPAFRSFSSEAIAAIESADEVWMGFLARFDGTVNINSFSGLSVFSDSAEQLFVGGGFSTTQWSLTFGSKDVSSEATSAEWSHVLVHVDYVEGRTILWLNGTPAINRPDVPSRGWNRIRITNGPATGARLYVDNLKIGESREAAESPLPPLLYAGSGSAFREHNYGSQRNIASLLYGALDVFPVGLGFIRGMAADKQGRVFTGHRNTGPGNGTVIAHDRAGNELFRWSAPSTLNSMESIGEELVIGSDGGLSFHDPDTGFVSRELSNPCSSGLAPSGLAFDGVSLRAVCGADILSLDPSTGTVLGSLANVATAADCPLGIERFGLAATAPGELTIVCPAAGMSGIKAWRFRSNDGSIIDTTAQASGDALAVRPVVLDPDLFSDRFESD